MLYIKLDMTPSYTSPITLELELPDTGKDTASNNGASESDGAARLTAHNRGFLPIEIRGGYLPAFKKASYPLAREHARRLHRYVTRTRMTPFSDEPLNGVEGTRYTLEILQGTAAALYQWWYQVPPGWEVVGEITTFLTDEIARFRQLNTDGDPMNPEVKK